MNASVENPNSAHVDAIIGLISIMSIHFHIGNFVVVSTTKTDPLVMKFQKAASKDNLALSFQNFNEGFGLTEGESRGYLIMESSQVDFSKIMKMRPKLVLGIFITKHENLTTTENLPELVVPASTFFFIVKLSSDTNGFARSTSDLIVAGKCLVYYRPIPDIAKKILSLMYYGGTNEADLGWKWEKRGMDWNFYRKEVMFMKGVTITIAIASHREKQATIDAFMAHKNSFFWRALADYLGFRFNPAGFSYRIHIHVEHVPQDTTNITRIYLKLLMTVADGLGVLPVMTPERSKYLEFVPTGLDSKFQLMVRTPQFIYSWQSILKPLSSEVWMYLGIVILLISLALRLITNKMNLKSMDFSSCLLTIFGFVCCQSSTSIPRNLSSRLVCYTALLFSFSIYQFYTSNFYSLLSTKEVSLPFTSLEQFLAKRTHSLYINSDTAIYPQIVKAKNGTFKRLWDEVLKNDPHHQLKVDNRLLALTKVCQGKGAILGLPFQTVAMSELSCELVPVNSGYFPTNIVTVVRKRFPFKPQFKYTHLRLLEGGISHKFRDDFLEVERKVLTKTNKVKEPVSLEHVAFLFAFYGVFIVLSFIILGLEILSSKSFSKPGKRRMEIQG